MKTLAIQAEKLTYRYGKVEALRGLDLVVPSQSIYALLGPNGAGKSTTFSILINALQPASGQAHVLGCRSTHLVPYNFTRMGYVAETQDLPDWMTGNQMLDFLKPLYPGWDDAFCSRLQKTLDLPLKRKIEELSRGEQMKLRLLSSMAYRPELLLLDEPFSGLDPLTREEISDALLELTGEDNWTVMIASHDVNDVERIADTAGYISQGQIHFSETVEDLQKRFHRVTAEFSSLPDMKSCWPDWFEVKAGERQLRFVDPHYDEARCRERLQKTGTLVHMESRSLSLREIFISETKHQRDNQRLKA
ncbi:MAG: ABC transporter ATP-binding protein [Kiritimatiellae bacterium]|jgi:ABC-2 type transport system ATP-binding protein|nr:ABC transporter ATP-binding protein [Kiritimatiellia bacterium]